MGLVILGWATPPTGPLTLTGSTNTWIPTITGADALAGTANFTYDGNVLDVKNSGTASSINLYCETGNAHYIKIKSGPHASATSYTLTMPNAPPSATSRAMLLQQLLLVWLVGHQLIIVLLSLLRIQQIKL